MSAVSPIGYTHALPRPPDGDGIQAILDRHSEDYPRELPVGCNLVVMREGEPPSLLHAGNIPPNGPQNWGSTSKQFTAACIDQLVKQGKIRYDDDIRTLCPDLPEFKLNGAVQRLTVDDLLHMRSGLPEVWATSLLNGVDAEHLNNSQLLELLHRHPGMVFAPGAKQMYCNTNYYVLAKIVEDVSGRPFVDYVREEVFVPLNMQARCSIDPSCPTTIPGYDGDPSNKTYMTEVTSPNCSYGTTGLIGPPSDMIRWNDAIRDQEFALLELPQGAAPGEEHYCRGLIVGQVGDYRRIYHGGMLAGAVTIYRRYEHADPRKTFAFFLATNADHVGKAEQIADDVANALAGEAIEQPRHAQADVAVVHCPKREAQQFNGTFRCEELGSEWVVCPKEQSVGKWAVHMMLTDHSAFPRIDFDPKYNEEGKLFFQSRFGNAVLEPTEDGFIYRSEIIAPLHFVQRALDSRTSAG